MLKRIFLFTLTNILVLLTITIVLQLLGVAPYLTAYGIDYKALLIFCLAWGMGGAFISLGLSRIMARWTMRVKVIDPRNPGEFRDLVNMVHGMAQKAGLPAMPEVGVYDSPDVNAFATGPTRSRSLVAVSTGLLRRMDRDQVEGVIGHEVAHVANGDMVTMTLIQGVINAFVMFFARVAAYAVSAALRRNGGGGSNFMLNFILIIVFQIVFGLLGSIVVSWFSRQREFRADHGGARLAGKDRMIAALRGLQTVYGRVPHDREEHASLDTLKISATRGRKFAALLSTHPPLELRIARLQGG